MNEHWKRALRKIRPDVVSSLANPQCVVDCLYATGILNAEMKGQIEANNTREDTSRAILDTLNYRGVRSIHCLYNAFQQTSNEHLADKLVPYVLEIEMKENLNDPISWPPTQNEVERMSFDKVLKIMQTSSAVLHEYNKPDVYSMKNKVRGKVLMINNKFEGREDERKGSEKDVVNLKAVFEQLHFSVNIGHDLTKKEMFQFLEKTRDAEDWDNMDCLVLILMSHGRGISILGSDGEYAEINDFLRIFQSENCLGLHEKPRLVFVQACRGKESGEKDDKPPKKGNTHTEVPSTQKSPVAMKHPSADFLVAFATPEGSKAYRNEYTGSWFLNAVVWTLKYHALNEEIQHLLIRVNRIVAQGKTDETLYTPIYTVSEVRSNLRKKLYFFPGVHGDKPMLF